MSAPFYEEQTVGRIPLMAAIAAIINMKMPKPVSSAVLSGVSPLRAIRTIPAKTKAPASRETIAIAPNASIPMGYANSSTAGSAPNPCSAAMSP